MNQTKAQTTEGLCFRAKGLVAFILFFLLTFFSSFNSFAWTEKALESSDPFVFKPSDLSLNSFQLKTNLPWSWVKDSFEWVRIDHRYLIPRARVKIQVPEHSWVQYQGKTTVPQKTEVELLVVLTQEANNEIRVNDIKIPIELKMSSTTRQRLIVDSSCSSAPLKVKMAKLVHSWAIVYCHTVHPKQGQGYSAQLDVGLFWNSEKKEILTANQLPIPDEDGASYHLSFNSSSALMSLQKGEDQIVLEPAVPPIFHPFSFSAGLGPYSNQNVLRPFATLYAAYFFNDQMKLASFSAFPIRSTPEIDTGLYVVSEQFRGLDERMSMNLLLGAHVLYFSALGNNSFKFSAPQGVELGFKDFLQKRQNLLVGGFFYPSINQRSYVNVWVRVARGPWFAELNFINWQEAITGGTFESKSFGISVGIPLFRAF